MPRFAITFSMKFFIGRLKIRGTFKRYTTILFRADYHTVHRAPNHRYLGRVLAPFFIATPSPRRLYRKILFFLSLYVLAKPKDGIRSQSSSHHITLPQCYAHKSALAAICTLYLDPFSWYSRRVSFYTVLIHTTNHLISWVTNVFTSMISPWRKCPRKFATKVQQIGREKWNS